jgi:hypothetical protein
MPGDWQNPVQLSSKRWLWGRAVAHPGLARWRKAQCITARTMFGSGQKVHIPSLNYAAAERLLVHVYV